MCLVEKASDATAALGRTVAPHIRQQSTKLLPTCLTQPSSPGGSSTFDDACDIAASGLKGLTEMIIIRFREFNCFTLSVMQLIVSPLSILQ